MTETLFTGDGQRMSVGAHVCAIHEDPTRVLETISRAFQTGLDRNERCAYVGPGAAADRIRRTLSLAGVDVAEEESAGRLVFAAGREPFLKDGAEFDPRHLLEAIKALFGQTIEAGYAGLRLSADVPWLAGDARRGGDSGSERIMEFEALADEVVNVPGVPLLAICQYRLSELEPEDSLGILERHPLTLVGGRIHTNDKYRPAG